MTAVTEVHEDDEDDCSQCSDMILDQSVRQFRVPSIKWQAKLYHTVVNLFEIVSEPAVTASLTNTELTHITDASFPAPRWLSNTQPVEKGIKVLTEAAGAVAGAEQRNGFIRQRLHSRSKMPRFVIKKDFSF